MNGHFGQPWFAFKYAPDEGVGSGGGGIDKTLEDVANKVAKDMGLNDDGTKKGKEKDEADEADEEDEEGGEKKGDKGEKKEKKKSKDADDDDDEDDDEDELDEASLAEAKTLYKVLNGPKAKEGLIALVRAAGLKLEEVEEGDEISETDKKKVTKTIKAFVKERLGDKYEFLSEDLGTLLEDLFKEFGDKGSEDIRADLKERRVKEVRQEIKSAYDETLASYESVSEKVLKEVLRIQQAEELVLGPKTDARKYFRAVFTMAAENLGVALAKKTATSKQTTRKEKDKVISELNSRRQRGGTEHKEGTKSTQVKTLEDIIKESAEKVEAQMSSK